MTKGRHYRGVGKVRLKRWVFKRFLKVSDDADVTFCDSVPLWEAATGKARSSMVERRVRRTTSDDDKSDDWWNSSARRYTILQQRNVVFLRMLAVVCRIIHQSKRTICE